jgi:hypothetical protein
MSGHRHEQKRVAETEKWAKVIKSAGIKPE